MREMSLAVQTLTPLKSQKTEVFETLVTIIHGWTNRLSRG